MGRTEAQTELGVRRGTRGGLKTHRLVSTQYARQAVVEHTAEGIDQGTAVHARVLNPPKRLWCQILGMTTMSGSGMALLQLNSLKTGFVMVK